MQYLYFISQAYTSFLITPRRRQIYHRYLLEVRFATDTSYQYLLLEVKNVWVTCITRSKRYYRLLLNVRNTTLSLEVRVAIGYHSSQRCRRSLLEVRVAIGYHSKLEMSRVITRGQRCHILFQKLEMTSVPTRNKSYHRLITKSQRCHGLFLEVRDDIGYYKKSELSQINY